MKRGFCYTPSRSPPQRGGEVWISNMVTPKNFSVTKTIKEKPFVSRFLRRNKRLLLQMKNAILGQGYNLSLVFIGGTMSRSLNRAYRGKDKPTDVLSFPLSKTEGEIFINFTRAEIEAKKFKRETGNFVLFLVIHALCHLKGMTHSSRMEALEKKYRAKFKI